MTTTTPRPFTEVARDLYPALKRLQRDLRGEALSLPIGDERGGELVLVAGHASRVVERLTWLCGPLEERADTVDVAGLRAMHLEMIESIADVDSLEVAMTVGLLGSLIASVRSL